MRAATWPVDGQAFMNSVASCSHLARRRPARKHCAHRLPLVAAWSWLDCWWHAYKAVPASGLATNDLAACDHPCRGLSYRRPPLYRAWP
ncbi:hypothetical protein BHE74_00035242 [Ensete ventricosum]|nr:hypothetical protein BHE74_00035242 [Ensete ventricosum]